MPARIVSIGNTTESGQALVELALVLPLFLLLIAGAMWFGPQAYAKLASETISYDCATAASQSLDAVQGMKQGRTAAVETARGFRVPPRNVTIHVLPPARWDRGQAVACSVAVAPYGGGLPLVGAFFPAPAQVTSRTQLLIELYKSRWR